MSTLQTDKLNSITTDSKSKMSAGIRQSIYQSVWRWHFYAGIIFAPFLIILAFSGAVYLFKPQIEGYLYKDMLTVREVGSTPLAPEIIAEKVIKAYPGTSISSITLDSNPKSSYKLSVNRDGASTTMYVDPYTGHALGMLDSNKTFTAFFKKMHSELVIGGTFANRIIELAACWAIILILTGLYLWWPRKKPGIWGTIMPRFSKPGSRLFWRDLHAVPAFWISIVLLIIIVSGLPWSSIMGGKIDKLANSTNTNTPPFAYNFGAKPESVTVAKDIAEDLPWAAENLSVPGSIAGGYVPLGINDIVLIADEQQVIKPYTLTMPSGETGVYTVSTSHPTPVYNATLHIDQYSGAVLTDVRFADYGIMAKAISYGIAFHEGTLFGLANQLLGLIACLGLILVCISSYMMWRKRQPSGKLGAPAKPKNNKITIGVLIIMLVCGAIMPLAGLSILIIIALDFVILRRIKSLRHWFSI
ncbi:PepSY-associated TM helix domain-containing protein [Paenibacillus sinopodophylli]|uniref:PepSY-associated TM helix domain-containing protein n=1 Tax=Paenibacillus sinopodophylli TaxID=1837342 RepID=UPI001FE9CCE1|nr:PepSY domain-containing protein [Paenibacillus sinopodophylli]